MSIMFTGEWRAKAMSEEKTENGKKVTLDSQDKELLLKLAGKTLEYYMKNNKMPAPEELGIKITDGMKQVMGAFVTLHKNGRLRGCIGEIIPRRPLYQAVMAQAVNSALRDWRFPQVTEKELPEIDFEISALSPSKPVDSYNDIVIGKNGMTIYKNGRSAVFLPQVAPEQGWGLAETLTHLSVKAGLPPDAWKEGAKFTVFEAIVFGEKDTLKK
jgi:AmmeMemoRadiSam system protein A